MQKLALQVMIIVVVWLSLASVCLGKQVFLADGSILACESFRRAGDTVVVKVNRDVLLEFNVDEIDMNRTFSGKIAKQKPMPKQPEVPSDSLAALPRSAAPGNVASAGMDVSQPAPIPAPQEVSATKEIVPPEPAQADAESPPEKVDLERQSKEAAAMMAEAIQKNDPELMKKAIETQQAMMEQDAEATPLRTSLKPILIMLVICLLIIASMWVIFEKAGEAGWKSLVPIYNIYVITEISGKPWWWFLLLLIPFVGTIIYLIVMVALAERFGRGVLYGLGLFLLPMFFMPMLAFGGAQYQGE